MYIFKKIKKKMYWFFYEWKTPHTAGTANSQTYFQHLRFAYWGNSLGLFYSCVGYFHGLSPEWPKRAQFKTSSGFIKLFCKILKSRRHDPEIEKFLGKKVLKVLKEWREEEEKKKKARF